MDLSNNRGIDGLNEHIYLTSRPHKLFMCNENVYFMLFSIENTRQYRIITCQIFRNVPCEIY